MGKYDGLIIPRSYNDYYNKSQPEELRNGIIQNTLGALDTDKGQPVNSAAVNNALENYQPKFNYVSSQEIQLDNNASYIICSHHPYDSNYNFYGLVLNYNDVITEFIISNSNTDLPYTKNGTKLNFKGGYWLTRIQKIASSINN